MMLIMALMVWTLLGTWKVMEAKCSNFSTSPTLDGLAYALPEKGGADSPGGGREMSSEDARAILWLLDLQRFEPDAKRLILESPGDPYSIFGRVSAFSGIPTLIGVPNHEGIWNRGKPEALEAMSKRQRDVETLYRTSDFRKARDLRVMDATAFALARENAMPIIVFSIGSPGAIEAVLRGKGRATLVGE